jgi:hypothetical protein
MNSWRKRRVILHPWKETKVASPLPTTLRIEESDSDKNLSGLYMERSVMIFEGLQDSGSSKYTKRGIISGHRESKNSSAL